MTDEKWESLLERIQRKFGFEARTRNEPVEEGGSRETVIFKSPAGKMKLERISRPLVIDKKIHYSKRLGSGRNVEYVFSPSEKAHRERLFRWNGTDWEEMDLGAITR